MSHQLQIRPNMGLLTTVADLPPSYKLQYATRLTESPLDLTIKAVFGAITPPATPSPLKKRYREEDEENHNDNSKMIKTEMKITIKKEVTPTKPINNVPVPRSSKVSPPSVSKERKAKAARKLKFDEDNSSPVSGTIIISLDEVNSDTVRESGDIDPQYNVVEVSDEVRAELAAIPNVIGAYNCKLCRLEFEDAFGLAQHRCSCIVLLEYKCPECGKRFNCPANLASHRRWHKPRDQITKKSESDEPEQKFPCSDCGKVFKRPAYLRKHQLTHKNITKTKSNASKSAIEIPVNYRSSEDSSSNNSVDSRHHKEVPHPVFTIISNPTDDDDDDDDMSDHLIINEDHQDTDENSHSSYYERFTEEENLAAAALAHLRNGPSVIRHTTALAV